MSVKTYLKGIFSAFVGRAGVVVAEVETVAKKVVLKVEADFTGIEAVIKALTLHAANGASTVFVEIPSEIEAVARQEFINLITKAMGGTVNMPALAVLPAGVGLAVVAEKVEEIKAAVEAAYAKEQATQARITSAVKSKLSDVMAQLSDAASTAQADTTSDATTPAADAVAVVAATPAASPVIDLSTSTNPATA